MAGFGLRLTRSQGMEGFTGNSFEYPILSTNANPIYTGDPVVLSGGYIVAATAVAGPILGIFNGCRYVDSRGDYQFENQWDGSTGNTLIFATVAIPVASMFHVRGETGVTFSQADVGAAHPFVVNAGSPQYGDSRYTINAAGAGSLVVHGLVDIPGNTWDVDEPILEVSVNLQSATYADAS